MVLDVARSDEHVRNFLVQFIRALRDHGVSCPSHSGIDAYHSLSFLSEPNRSLVKEALRTTLLTDHEDEVIFEKLFHHFWSKRDILGSSEEETQQQFPDVKVELSGASREETENKQEEQREQSLSSNKQLSDSQVAESQSKEITERRRSQYSPWGTHSEHNPVGYPAMDQIKRDVEIFCRAVSRCLGRRRGSGRPTDRPDIRRALRSNMQTGGALLHLPRRERKLDEVRLATMVDVSESVLDIVPTGYLLQLVKYLQDRVRTGHTLLFDHDIQDVTEIIETPTQDEDLSSLVEGFSRWKGGTRIGLAFQQIGTTFSGWLDPKTVVLVISDGLDQGDIDQFRRWISSVKYRSGLMIWMNPLAVQPDYEPTARAMSEALPFLDGLFALRGPGDLTEVAQQLERLKSGHGEAYQFDSRSQ